MPLFNFELTPLREIRPWGESDKPTLHWWGLTEGQQWIDAGREQLFEFSIDFLAKFGGTRYINYELARLYEDLTDLLPYVLEPVPDALAHYMHGTNQSEWESIRRSYYSEASESVSTYRNDASDHTSWAIHRKLFCQYLSAPPEIRLWSTLDGFTHVAWEAGHCLFEGVRVWSAESGVFSITTLEFERELNSFHHRLLAAMDERIEEVRRGALDPAIDIDVSELERAQHEYRLVYPKIQRKLNPPTDWVAAGQAIEMVMRTGRKAVPNSR